MEYAGGEKIREFLSNKMELVWINGLIVIFYLLVSEQNSRNCMQKGIIPIDRSDHQIIRSSILFSTLQLSPNG